MTTHRRLTLRHVLLVSVLVGIALLLRGHVAMPVQARIPGLLLLVALAAWLAVSSFRTRRAHRA